METQTPLPFAIMLFLLGIAPIFWGVVTGVIGVAVWKSKRRNTALNIALLWAFTMATSEAVVSYLSVNRLLGIVLDSGTILPFLIFALLFPVLPAIVWLYAFLAKKF